MLKAENLTHIYSDSVSNRPILSNTTLSLNAGDQLLLRGISGSGKTTLINILAGLLTPTEGTVTIDGQDIYALSEAERDAWRRSNIGYVFQTHHLLPLLNSWENVALPLAFDGVSTRERKEKALSILDEVGLIDQANKRPNKLSTGQRQRGALARALVNEPALILADEPTASLDQESADIALDLLQAQNCMLIVASHDPSINSRFSRIADVQDGHLQEVAINA